MNVDLTNNIYNDLKVYAQNSEYKPTVVKKALRESKKFPLITIVEENNVFKSGTTNYKKQERIDSIYWEVNIYATDIKSSKKTISNAEICDNLKVLVDNVMSRKYRLTRLSCRPTPNLDDTIYRVTMRYTCDLLTNRNKII